MYTLVLMSALTSAPDAPQFNGFFRDLFGGGCRGNGCHASCHGGIFGIRDYFQSLGCRGSCMGTCHGSTCHGNGSGSGTCHGCNGGGRGREYDRGYDRGYASGCTGCNGYAMAPAACFGNVSYGQCIGSMPMGGGFNYGTPTFPGGGGDFAQPRVVDYGAMVTPAAGCNCDTVAGMPTVGAPMLGTIGGDTTYPPITSPNLPVPRAMPGVEVERRYKEPLTQPEDSTRANVLVKLPADAKLFVEGRPLSVTNGTRAFVTPPLPADRDAVYAFKMEYPHHGDTHAVTKTVRVRAGTTQTVEFADPRTADKAVRTLPDVPTVPNTDRPALATAAGKPAAAGEVPTVQPPFPQDRAKLTVHLPPGATLFVNGAKNERKELVREFVTPKLAAGKTYQYAMKIEQTRNGLPESQEQVVDFRPGDVLTVDFTKLPTNQQASR